MSQDIEKMYTNSADIANVWVEKLFPLQDQGCINFGYWKGVERPITDRKRTESQKRLYLEIFSKFPPNSVSVLEVGCGRGHGVFWLTEKGYKAFGIDVLPGQIERSKASYPHLASCFKIGEAECIPYGDNLFDCVYSLEAAQHFISFDIFCKEAYRVLKNNGKLVLSTYFINDHSYITDIEKIIPTNMEGFDKALVISDAVQLLEENGFEVFHPPISIGAYVFPCYAEWHKIQLGNTHLSDLSEERMKWKEYYTGGGKEPHPWYLVFKNGWIDYYILEATKKE